MFAVFHRRKEIFEPAGLDPANKRVTRFVLRGHAWVFTYGINMDRDHVKEAFLRSGFVYDKVVVDAENKTSPYYVNFLLVPGPRFISKTLSQSSCHLRVKLCQSPSKESLMVVSLEEHWRILRTAEKCCLSEHIVEGQRIMHACLSSHFQNMITILSPSSRQRQNTPRHSRSLLTELREIALFIQSDSVNLLKSCLWVDHVDPRGRALNQDETIIFGSSLEVCLHAFHVELRSVSDYLAAFVLKMFGRSVDRDMATFQMLRDWHDNRNVLPLSSGRMFRAIQQFIPFQTDVAFIRNSIVHRGADAFVRVNAQISGRRRLGFGILLSAGSARRAPEFFPEFLFDEAFIDLRYYFGFCVGKLVEFLNDFALGVLEYLQDLEWINWRESLNPFFPSTIARLLASGVSVTRAFQIIQSFPFPGTVPQLIMSGLSPLAAYGPNVIKIEHSSFNETFVAGTPSAVQLIREAKVATEVAVLGLA